MKRLILSILLFALSIGAHAQFSPNTVLTASALNAALAAPAITAGSINGSTSILTTGTVTLNGTNTFGANTSAVTQGYTDNTTHVATTAYVKQQILARTAWIPMTITGGTYNFASAGTGAIFGVTTSGGAIASVTGIVAGGTGYQVGDVLTMVGGNGDGLLYVSAVSSGVVTSATVFYGGTGYTGTPQLSGSPLPPGSRTGGLTGTLTSNATIVIPSGTFLAGARRIGFNNATTGAFSITIKLSDGAGGSTGTGFVLPQGPGHTASLIAYTDGVTDVWPEVDSVPSLLVSSSLTVPGVFTLHGITVLPQLSGTTSSLGGSSLAAGACSTTTVAISGATNGMAVSVTPVTFPGPSFYWRGYVTAPGVVTVGVCNSDGNNTPTASIYNVRVSQ